MSILSKIRSAFFNPPTSGAGQGGPAMIPNSMGPMPRTPTKAVGYNSEYGEGLREQRMYRLGQLGSEEAYDEAFRENAVINPSSGPQAQTSLRASFEAGEMTARTGTLHSSRVGQTEFRNYDRGRIEAQPVGDPSGVTYYDVESASSGDPHGTV